MDFKANAEDDINEGGIPERVDARPPDPPIEIPPRVNVRRMYIRKVDDEKYGPTKGCPGCQKVRRGTVPSRIVATQSDVVNMMQDPVGADRVVRTTTRQDEAFARHVEEHDEREEKISMATSARMTREKCTFFQLSPPVVAMAAIGTPALPPL